MKLISGLTATSASLMGLGVGLMIGSALAVAVHGAMAAEARK